MQRFGECLRRLMATIRRRIFACAGPVLAGVQLVEVMSIHPYKHGVLASSISIFFAEEPRI
jgi:hypothetical protein